LKKLRYKAYLSYSHSDEKWADWLHRGLESYRIPGRLRESSKAELPESLAPIFRDRDDLSSSADLNKTLLQALAQSGALLLICSPAAATSRWVNEEVRAFRKMHGEEHILCMVVDGDPQAPAGEGGCFPPALFEPATGERAPGDGIAPAAPAREPLAADPRDFADGKRLALLKMVSGLLGVRLDELRRRDLARRRRGRLVLAAAAVGALTLGGLTWNAKVQERAERAQSEQMASFIVGLGEELRGDLDLESLGRISATAMGYLDQLDPDQLTPASRIGVGKALRQVGDVKWNQGDLQEARDAYDRSLGIFMALNDDFPEDDEIWFQLSQAEFYAGYVRYDLNEFEETMAHLERYAEIAAQRHQALPDDPRWLLELSYSKSNLVNIALTLDSGLDEEVLVAIQENIALAGRALEANDGNPEAMGHYLNELAFAADAQVSVCNLREALRNRLASLEINKRLLQQQGVSGRQELEVALREVGLGALLVSLGDLPQAREHTESAVNRLERLLAGDPSNETTVDDYAYALQTLAFIDMYQGELQRAEERLSMARTLRLPLMEREVVAVRIKRGHRELVFFEALHAQLAGERKKSLELLEANRSLLLEPESGTVVPEDQQRLLIRYRYALWRMTGLDPAVQNASLVSELPVDQGEFNSCVTADLLARHELMGGDMLRAQHYVSYLAEAGYREPAYLEFCRSEGLCSP
jgi:tetratricopeptide (TPR) repeat protein